jgi:hypothetical protein
VAGQEQLGGAAVVRHAVDARDHEAVGCSEP